MEEKKVTQKLHARKPTGELHVGVIIDNFKIIVVKILWSRKIARYVEMIQFW